MIRQASLLSLAFFLAISFSGCSRYYTVKTVKPKSHYRFYNPKKDKHKKRTKIVKLKVRKLKKN